MGRGGARQDWRRRADIAEVAWRPGASGYSFYFVSCMSGTGGGGPEASGVSISRRCRVIVIIQYIYPPPWGATFVERGSVR